MEANLAFYRRKDWKKFLSMIDDRETMFDTWAEWHETYLRTKNELSSMGLKVNKVKVNLNELDHFCRKNGLKNNGETRSRFVSGKR